MNSYEYQDIIIRLKEKKAVLEAKCYAYEQIIAKSNFAPFVKEETDCITQKGDNK